MIDLHLHSTHSDGTKTPAELVKMAKNRNFKAISITDHDTVSGTAEAVLHGDKENLLVIPGVELSVFHADIHFHLLGYGIDWRDNQLLSDLKRLQVSRNERNTKIIQKLQNLGIKATTEELQFLSGVGQTGRPHIARLLVRKNIVKTIDQAFARYLKKDACAYVPRFIYHVKEAIDIIVGAGGLAVLAHPVQIDRTLGVLPEILDELVPMGLKGLEVYYPTQRGKVRQRLSLLAKKYNLLETGGSDYHGDIRSGTSMAVGKNMAIPIRLLENLQQALMKPKKLGS